MERYFMPTSVLQSENCVLENAEMIASLGKKALIVTGVSSAVKSGALEDITTVLKRNGQVFVLYDKVMNNPTIDCAYEGGALAKKEKADFVIAIGGGSPMDAAKVMALLACQEIKREIIFSGKYENTVLPILAIPTTSGTGSEVTPYAVLTNDAEETKSSVATPLIFPKVALLDGKYTTELPQEITVDTAIDALSHAMEGYLSVKAGTITDGLAEKSMTLIGSLWTSLKKGSYTIEDRNILMKASTLAGMVISNTGTTLVHAMGYPLTYFHGIAHGRANAFLLPGYLGWMQGVAPEKTAKVLDCLGFSTVEAFSEGIGELLGEKGDFSQDDAKKYAERVAKAPQLKNGLAIPSVEIIEWIYRQGAK